MKPALKLITLTAIASVVSGCGESQPTRAVGAEIYGAWAFEGNLACKEPGLRLVAGQEFWTVLDTTDPKAQYTVAQLEKVEYSEAHVIITGKFRSIAADGSSEMKRGVRLYKDVGDSLELRSVGNNEGFIPVAEFMEMNENFSFRKMQLCQVIG